VAKKIKSAAPLTPDIPRTILSTTIDESDEPRQSKKPIDSGALLDALLLMRWAAHFGLPNELTPRVYYELAVRLAKELEANEKKKPGRTATFRTGAGAIQLATELRMLMEGTKEGKEAVISWIYNNDKRYSRIYKNDKWQKVSLATFRAQCHEACRKYGEPHKP
jgi:hypothetical protein